MSDDLKQAESMYKKSLEIHQELGRNEGMATMYAKLGEIYYTRRNLDQAEDMFKKSLEVEETPDNKAAMARAYGYLGDINRLKNDLSQAEEMYIKGLKLSVAIGSEPMIEIMRTMLTNLKMKKKQGNKIFHEAAKQGHTDIATMWHLAI